ncbi:hypothetical protein LEP1GSC073_1096 [Leptospira noguchii str. Cascata]|nr:hypothetical protein LEP1GSC073_1096 [Leptospira noguchii str. Cascata]
MSYFFKFFQKHFHIFLSYKNNLIKLLLIFQLFTVCDFGSEFGKERNFT